MFLHPRSRLGASAVVLLGIASCAQQASVEPSTPDALQNNHFLDSGYRPVDAALPHPQDAALPHPDAKPVDAAMPDVCAPQVTQLLTNTALDMAPVGIGWQQTLAAAGYPLITDEDGVAEHTPFYKV